MGHEFILLFTGATLRPAMLLVGIIVAASMIHLAITNLAACVALLVPITMTIAHGAGINLIVCAR